MLLLCTREIIMELNPLRKQSTKHWRATHHLMQMKESLPNFEYSEEHLELVINITRMSYLFRAQSSNMSHQQTC
jgi:hypothetical protein